MDIKIGRVTWDDDADETFRERRRMKWPLREITGFSILGFMVWLLTRYNNFVVAINSCYY